MDLFDCENEEMDKIQGMSEITYTGLYMDGGSLQSLKELAELDKAIATVGFIPPLTFDEKVRLGMEKREKKTTIDED